MKNRIALITGATSGIGRITALELAKKGFDLILLARNEEKALQLQREIGDLVKTDFIECDLSSIQSVRKAVEMIRQRYTRIDVLINNAGIIMQHKKMSADGIEMTFATNHMGPFVLTIGLIALLQVGTRSRIIHVSSAAHYFAFFKIDKLADPDYYQDLIVYGRSKLANILFSNELAERLEPFGITSNCVHPGTVASNFAGDGTGVTSFFMRLLRPFFKTTQQGASTTIYVATSPDLEGITGKYFVNSKPAGTSGAAKNKELGKKLWELSEELIRTKAK